MIYVVGLPDCDPAELGAAFFCPCILSNSAAALLLTAALSPPPAAGLPLPPTVFLLNKLLKKFARTPSLALEAAAAFAPSI